jgi:hypothetical protein
MRQSILAVVLWLSCSLYTYPTMLADLQHIDPGDCREAMGMSLGYGLIFGPVASVFAFFASGFNAYGMQWTCPAEAEAGK